MAKHEDERRDSRAPRGAALLRVAYGAGLLALGACLGIVIGSLSETPRLVLERLRGPVETVDVAVPAKPAAEAEVPPLERFGDLQEGRAPKAARAVPSPAKPAVEAEPPPPLVPPAELEPAPAVAAAPPSAAPSEPPPEAVPVPAETREALQPHGAVVQVASYVERKPADELVQKLEERGFDAYVSQPAASNGRFRVRIRPGAGENAGDLATRLRGFGFDTWATSE